MPGCPHRLLDRGPRLLLLLGVEAHAVVRDAQHDQVADPSQGQHGPAGPGMTHRVADRLLSDPVQGGRAVVRHVGERLCRIGPELDVQRCGLGQRLKGGHQTEVVQHQAVQAGDRGPGLGVGQVGQGGGGGDLGARPCRGLVCLDSGSLSVSSAADRWNDMDASAVVTPSCRSKAIRRRSASCAEIAWAISWSRSLRWSWTAASRPCRFCSHRPSRSTQG